MPLNQKILLVIRALVGIVGIIAGCLTYPTGVIVPAQRAVPLALIVVGAVFVVHVALDLLWAGFSKRGAPEPAAGAKKAAAGAEQAAAGAEQAAAGAEQAPAGASQAGAGNAQQSDGGALTAIGSFVAAMTTVLGLLAVFGTSPNNALRLGTLVLVIGVIVGLMLLLFVANGIGGLAAQSMIAWIVNILFGTAAFGLACIGFAVFFR